MASDYIAQASLDLEILLPKPHECLIVGLCSASVSHPPLLVLRHCYPDLNVVSSYKLPVGECLFHIFSKGMYPRYTSGVLSVGRYLIHMPRLHL